MLRFLGTVALAGATAVAAVAWAAQSGTQPLPAVARSDPGPPLLHKTAGELPSDATWFDRIFEREREREREPEPKPPRRRNGSDRSKGWTYRTLCVRLCDGFYFPISYATQRWRFAADAETCEKRCPAGARLFVHRNPGEGVDDMVDLKARPYRSLPTAFLHRSQYIENCTCHGNPWDEASLARHRAYAEAAKKPVAGKRADRRGQ
jgi:hypothetical protein